LSRLPRDESRSAIQAKESEAMDQQAELEVMRSGVNCAAVLEWHDWRVDERESSRDCLKYRRGEGEIVLVNHGGRGWWDPGSAAKGDVFGLIQFLEPGLNFGQVRKALRPFIGVAPCFLPAAPPPTRPRTALPIVDRWQSRKAIQPGSACWTYLTQARHLPAEILMAVIEADIVREGPYGSVWFAHLNADGALTGIEMRGPSYRGFTSGGEKTLFRLPCSHSVLSRVVIAEAPIDALSVAAIEHIRPDTEYVATAGGLGPATLVALDSLFAQLSRNPAATAVIATDADAAGEGYAARLKGMAETHGVTTERLCPPAGAKDWNDWLNQGDNR
jgi:hypothetical protein